MESGFSKTSIIWAILLFFYVSIDAMTPEQHERVRQS